MIHATVINVAVNSPQQQQPQFRKEIFAYKLNGRNTIILYLSEKKKQKKTVCH